MPADTQADDRKFEAGQEVETIHGEKLVVLKVDVVLVKRGGVPTGETQRRILARSGDADCWFPTKLIK